MKQHKLTILGYLISIAVIFASITRWYFIYYDPSQAIFGFSVGLLIGILSYIYNWMRIADDRFNKLDKRLDAFASWEFKQQDEHIKSEIRGDDEED